MCFDYLSIIARQVAYKVVSYVVVMKHGLKLGL